MDGEIETMRKKELKLVVTFHTTADAMAMEKACREQAVPGRLILFRVLFLQGAGLHGARPLRSEPG